MFQGPRSTRGRTQRDLRAGLALDCPSAWRGRAGAPEDGWCGSLGAPRPRPSSAPRGPGSCMVRPGCSPFRPGRPAQRAALARHAGEQRREPTSEPLAAQGQACALSRFSRVCFVASVDYSPPGSPVYGDSPGKNSGVSYHALLLGIFPTQRLNTASLISPALAGGFFTTSATWEGLNPTNRENSRKHMPLEMHHLMICSQIEVHFQSPRQSPL